MVFSIVLGQDVEYARPPSGWSEVSLPCDIEAGWRASHVEGTVRLKWWEIWDRKRT